MSFVFEHTYFLGYFSQAWHISTFDLLFLIGFYAGNWFGMSLGAIKVMPSFVNLSLMEGTNLSFSCNALYAPVLAAILI